MREGFLEVAISGVVIVNVTLKRAPYYVSTA